MKSYISYFGDGKEIPDRYLAHLKDIDGNDTGVVMLKSPEGRFISELIYLFKNRNNSNENKEITTENTKSNTNNIDTNLFGFLHPFINRSKYFNSKSSQSSSNSTTNSSF